MLKAKLVKNALAEVSYKRLLDLVQRIAIASNEANSEEEAIQIALDEICLHTNWPIGHALKLGKNSQELQSMGIWHIADSQHINAFKKLSEEMVFGIGVGLPGRVLEKGKATWVSDVASDDNFPRARAAGGEKLGVKSAFGFPILTRDEVVGVLEFFSPDYTEPNEAFLGVMASIGTQVGRV